MTAIGRALMSRPTTIARRAVDGLGRSSSRRSSRSSGPHEREKVSILLAEQNTNVALRYPITATSWERPVCSTATPPRCAKRGRQEILSASAGKAAVGFPTSKHYAGASAAVVPPPWQMAGRAQP